MFNGCKREDSPRPRCDEEREGGHPTHLALILAILLTHGNNGHEVHEHTQIDKICGLEEDARRQIPSELLLLELRLIEFCRARASQPSPEDLHLAQLEGDVIELRDELQGQHVEEDVNHRSGLDDGEIDVG